MKITYKDYLIEISMDELKGLFPVLTSPSNKSPICNPKKPPIIKTPINNYNKKVTLEQIKQIKSLAESGMDNKAIAERLGLKQSLIPYWRRNTPKELA